MSTLAPLKAPRVRSILSILLGCNTGRGYERKRSNDERLRDRLKKVRGTITPTLRHDNPDSEAR